VLEDLGKVFVGTAGKKSLFISAERNEAALEVYRRPGADPLKLSRDVGKAVREAAALFGRDAGIRVVWDEAPSITGGIRNLFLSACFGSAAVAAVLFCSLRRFRYGLLAGFSIPLSASASLSVLAISGASLNGMSLSGIALGIGLVSDTAVIILDLLHKSFGRGEARPGFDELGRAAASVAASSLGGTVTTALVFLPVLFLPGPLGSLFGDLSLSLLVSVGTGWAYAQFALPCLYRLSFKAFPGPPRRQKPRTARDCYASLLKRVLRKPVPVLILAAALSVLGLALLSRRPAAFVSSGGIQELRFTLDFPAGTILESMESETAAAARGIAGIPGIAAVFGRAGAEDEDTGKRADPDYRKERAILRCMLVPGFDADKALAALNAFAASIKTGEAACGVSFPPDKTEKLLGLSSAATFALRAKDMEDLERHLAGAEKTIAGSGLVSKFSVRPREKRPEIRILPDRAASAFLGISQAEAARSVYASLEGVTAGEFEIGGRSLEMKVSGDPAGLSGPLEKLPVAVTEQGPVFLGSIGTMERREVPSALLRLDRSDAVYLDVFPGRGREKQLASFLDALCGNGGQEGLSRAGDSVFVQYKTSLVLTTVLVLLILYLSMAALFESFLLPLILMLTIPFSLAGAGPFLFLSGASLDFSSVLGLMVLFGLAVNSGMVLFERALEKTGRGLSPGTAVYGAAMDRCAPILATALTTALALVPMVSSLGGAQRSMATAMLGGVSASTLLSLFVLPPVFIPYLRKKRHG
jgi:multidrug efflux pump subunit AcrB